MIGDFLKGVLQRIKLKIEKLTFDASNNLQVGINADNVGLAKESTLSSINAKVGSIDTNVENINNIVDDELDNLGWVRVYAWDSTNNQWVYLEGKFNGETLTYDANGNLTEIRITVSTDAGDKTVRKTFSYDANGNLTGISRWEIVA